MSSPINFLPRLKYRWYSACSSPKTNQNLVKFAFTRAVYKNQDLKDGGDDHSDYQHFHKFGLCTNLLHNLKAGDSINLVQRSSTNFVPPEDPATPVVMIATGTGLAPFMAFLEERSASGLQNHLYFGCRHPELDYLYWAGSVSKSHSH